MKKKLLFSLLILIVFTLTGCKRISKNDFIDICKDDRIYSLNVDKKSNNKYVLSGKYFNNYELFDYKFNFDREEARSLILNDLGFHSSYFVSMNEECEKSLDLKVLELYPEERRYISKETEEINNINRRRISHYGYIVFSFVEINKEEGTNLIYISDFVSFDDNRFDINLIKNIMKNQDLNDLNSLLAIDCDYSDAFYNQNDIEEYTNPNHLFVLLSPSFLDINGKYSVYTNDSNIAVFKNNMYKKLITSYSGLHEWETPIYQYIEDINFFYNGIDKYDNRKIMKSRVDKMSLDEYIEALRFACIKDHYNVYVDKDFE